MVIFNSYVSHYQRVTHRGSGLSNTEVATLQWFTQSLGVLHNLPSMEKPSMDQWIGCMGKIWDPETRGIFPWRSWGFPVKCPLNQSIEWRYQDGDWTSEKMIKNGASMANSSTDMGGFARFDIAMFDSQRVSHEQSWLGHLSTRQTIWKDLTAE